MLRPAGLLVVLLVALPTTHAQESKLTSEDREALEWLSSIELPDVKGMPYVRIEETWDRERRGVFTSWLLDEDERSVHVFGATLNDGRIAKNVAREGVALVTSMGPIDLEAFASDFVAEFRAKGGDHFGDIMDRRLSGGLGLRAELVVFAWGCWRNGLDDLAHELLVEARKLPDRSAYEEHKKPFLPEVKRQIAARLHWNAAEAFADERITWRELRDDYRRLAEHFPDYDEHAAVEETAKTLDRMVREEEERAAHPPKGFESMTTDEKVVELVYRLRNGPGPMKEIEALGLDAVPKLIEALDDTSFTRSLHYGMKAYNRPFPQLVWEHVREILESMSGRGLWTNDMYATPDGPRKTARRLALEWWSEVQAKGQKQLLIDATVSGGTWSGHQARILVAKYPEAALAAIEKGFENATDEWRKSELISVAGEIEGDAPVPFLTAKLEKEPSLSCRLAAATALLKHGRREGIPKMIAAWNAGEGGSRGFGGNPLVSFLATCGAPEAIVALGKTLRARPVDVRLEVVETLGDVETKGAALDAIEKLLVETLEDTEERTGLSGSRNGRSFSDPRVCDFAAVALASLFPSKYVFDLDESLPARDRERLAITNAWREAHGKELVAPAGRHVVPAPEAITRPLVEKLLADDLRVRVEAARSLEAVGLPALPAVEEQLFALEVGSPLAPEVAALVTRIGCIVAVTTVTSDSVAPTATFLHALHALEGRPLTTRAYVDLVKLGIREVPPVAHGVSIEALRADDATGVSVTVKFLAVEEPAGGGSTKDGKRMPFCDTHELVTVGRHALHGSGGTGEIDFHQEDRAYTEVMKALDVALMVPVRVPFLAREKIVLHPGD
jgi:hypothetical protein